MRFSTATPPVISGTACSRKPSSRRSHPMPGYSPIHMIYRYGGSAFSTVTNSGRWTEAYRHRASSQSVDLDGRRSPVRRHHPARVRRWSVGTLENGRIPAATPPWVWHGQPSHADAAAQVHRAFGRVLLRLRHLCTAILTRLGPVAYSPKAWRSRWVKRVFDSSDLPDHIRGANSAASGLLRRRPKAELRHPVDMRWYAKAGRPAGTPPAAVTVLGNVRQGPADAKRQAGVRARALLKRHTGIPSGQRSTGIPSWEGLRSTWLVTIRCN